MRLHTLTLRNFKGIRSFVLDTHGRDVSIYGNNAAGKTTLADAFMWLLFDKDSSNRKDFEIKTLDEAGAPTHDMQHEVEAVISTADQRVTLRKVFYEKWTKKKGSAMAEFSGHTTDYYIDGVPAKRNEFQAAVASIAPEQVFRLLTDPGFFNTQVGWQERRRVLLEVCGDVTDADVISSDSTLAKLPDILGSHTLEQHRKVIQAKRTEINKELERIPVRIDEVQRTLPEVELDEVTLTFKLDEQRKQRQSLEDELSRIRSGGEVVVKENRIAALEGALKDLERIARSDSDAAIQGMRHQVIDLNGQLDIKSFELRKLNNSITQCRHSMEQAEAKATSLRESWHKRNDTRFTFEQADVCPTCGQDLPQWKLDEARDKAHAAYNQSKASDLEAISTEGKKLKEQIEGWSSQVTQEQNKADELQMEIESLQTKVSKLQEDIKQAEASIPAVNPNDPTYQKLVAEKQQVMAEIDTLKQDTSEASAKVSAKMKEIDQYIDDIQKDLLRHKQRSIGIKRIDELKAEERKLAGEFEDLEGQMFLTEQFVIVKVRLLEELINSRFRMVRFKLFNTLINGGVEECCETTYQGVPYGNLNHGAQLNAGLDIINTLSSYYKFEAPVWIDNAESVTSIIATRGQQIRLVVSASDKELRIEADEKCEVVA